MMRRKTRDNVWKDARAYVYKDEIHEIMYVDGALMIGAAKHGGKNGAIVGLGYPVSSERVFSLCAVGVAHEGP